MTNNPTTSTIDFNANGIQHGFFKIPYSSNTSAWGSIMIPVTQFKNGDGPTALLTGGNHGDEYEGPIALLNLCSRTNIDNISGRVIIIPAMNFPAFLSGDRVSPIDNVNMNRAFPGRPDGTVTQIIADYFSKILLPMADVVLDIHSGGKTLNLVPFSASHVLSDAKQDAECELAAKAFGAPYYVKMLEMDAANMYDTHAESMGKLFVTTELGGGGSTTPETVSIAKRGVDNFLIHTRVMSGDIALPEVQIIELNMPDNRSFVCSEHDGIIEPFVDLGDEVKYGEIVARIHSTKHTNHDPVDYFALRDGMIIAKHYPSIINMGDNINVIAEIVSS